MSMTKRISTAASTLLLITGLFFNSAQAQENEPLLDRNLFSIGVGISNNEVDGDSDDETGFQFFAAYDLNKINLMEGVNSSLEFGYMDFGFRRDDTGIWGSYVIDSTIGESFGWLAQLGLDVGDDSGLLLGAGVKYAIDTSADIRLEYVVRDEVDSLQINFLYHL